MAGSIPGSDLAERRPGLERPAPFHAVRWKVLRRAARARLAPFGAGVMLLAVLGALAAPLVAPYDPLAQNLGNTLARPDRGHLLGTDNVGRDVLSRVIWGTRVSLLAGLVSVALAVVAGSLLGIVAGYCGGRVDGLVMRLMDAVLSFPPLVLALALGAMLGAGLVGVLLALGVVYTPTFARLMRGQVLAITARDYVDAARALGASGWRGAWRQGGPDARGGAPRPHRGGRGGGGGWARAPRGGGGAGRGGAGFAGSEGGTAPRAGGAQAPRCWNPRRGWAPTRSGPATRRARPTDPL